MRRSGGLVVDAVGGDEERPWADFPPPSSHDDNDAEGGEIPSGIIGEEGDDEDGPGTEYIGDDCGDD